ncbi:hypothetical protein [Salinivibrio proteolyticus]|uniref:hypothetical protein n=1 Tax=Salinivibrio proteolyticus TaxID=334715 RepID=UPI000988E8F8|nr:hypothetical protein [Salinivibrio proteolyticus]OOF30362.1 hypothetical protein BZJ20_10875 [Salinivibrio proteolyticus]
MKSISLFINILLFNIFYIHSAMADSIGTLIPGVEDAYFQGSKEYSNLDPKDACNVFNNNVRLINAEIKKEYEDDPELSQLGLENNLCQHFRINDIQLEHTIKDTHTFFYPNRMDGGYYGAYESVIDVQKVIDILMFTSTDKTHYVMFVNGDATLAKQDLYTVDGRDYNLFKTYTGGDIAPAYLKRKSNQALVESFHGTAVTNLMTEEK